MVCLVHDHSLQYHRISFCSRGAPSNIDVATVLETNHISVVPGRGKHHAHISKPYRGPCLISTVRGKGFPCQICRLSCLFNAVDDGKRASRLGDSGKSCNHSRSDTKAVVLSAPVGRDPDLCGTVLGRVQATFKTRLLVESQFQLAGMSVAEMQSPRRDRPP